MTSASKGHDTVTVTRHAVHIKSKRSHPLPLNFTKFIDLYSHERQEEIYFKFMSFMTDPTDLVKWPRFIILSSRQHLWQLLNVLLYLGLTSSRGLGLFGSSLSNPDFRTRTHKWFKFFCSSLERGFETLLRRLLTVDHRNLGRSKRSPSLHLFPYGNKKRGSLCQTEVLPGGSVCSIPRLKKIVFNCISTCQRKIYYR